MSPGTPKTSACATQTIANYTAGFAYIWNELPVTVTFESDWRKAKKILQKIADHRCAALSDEAAKAIERAQWWILKLRQPGGHDGESLAVT